MQIVIPHMVATDSETDSKIQKGKVKQSKTATTTHQSQSFWKRLIYKFSSPFIYVLNNVIQAKTRCNNELSSTLNIIAQQIIASVHLPSYE